MTNTIVNDAQNPPMKCWVIVTHDGHDPLVVAPRTLAPEVVDTVYFNAAMSLREVRRFLIDHDGYDESIMVLNAAPVRNLTCVYCDAVTRGRQWWTQDEGFGVCTPCAAEKSNNFTQKDMYCAYGIKGYHYDV